MTTTRRSWLKQSALLTAGLGLARPAFAQASASERFPISLAQWSNHRALKGGQLDNLDWPAHTKKTYGIEALEYVNQFFYERPKDKAYLTELKKRTDDLGMSNVLIMCDRIGNLGNPDDKARTAAVEGHYAWVEAAKFLGCHSIRVNARSDDNLTYDEQKGFCVDGLRRLSEFAKPHGLGVIVENHGGLSSNGRWLAEVLKEVDLDNCGALPDFGNFYVARNRGNAKAWEAAQKKWTGDDYASDEKGIYYDRYQGIQDLMPYAKGVSAKAHDFDDQGNEIHTDFAKAMKLVADSGYQGYVGVEYEGKGLSEDEGILATKKLLERVLAAL